MHPMLRRQISARATSRAYPACQWWDSVCPSRPACSLHTCAQCDFAFQDDLERVKIAGNGRVDITVGSALDIFGGKLPYAEVLAWHRHQEQALSH